MKINTSIYRKPAVLFLVLLLAASCKKADRAYDKLLDIPELELGSGFIYKGSYLVGDTMVMYGRLNPSKSDFKVRIGNAAAPMLAWRNIPKDSLGVGGSIFANGLDEVKLKITSAMGAGEERQVHITSGGLTIEGPAVDILLTSPDTTSFNYALRLGLYYYMPEAGTKLFYCVNGKGSIYLYESGIIKAIRNRRASAIVTDFTDQYGSFTIHTLYGGGADFHERYVYFSALTEENSTEAASNHIFRLCRYDMETQELKALNRTLIPKDPNMATLERAFLPYEGNISAAKLQAVTGIFPDSSGNVVLAMQHFIHQPTPLNNRLNIIANLRADGALKYQFKNQDYNFQYYDPASGGLKNTRNVPGVSIAGDKYRISPNEKLLYQISPVGWTNSGYKMYDLITGDLLNSFTPKEETGNWVLEGPFSSLTFRDQHGFSNFYSHFPLPGKRLLLLLNRFQYLSEHRTTVLNFSSHTASPYAPLLDEGGLFDNGSYIEDPVLNYDEQGHLYIFSATAREILKTEKK
ncbi:hypothetical protein [Chitinophaga barathri]|uniref:DUF4374 domain-containing protein n=1 Tax=Chitinophaga barathri TaxID=1647451 RepID=A0A3N4MFC0_9BACT|nr:hypothetical protein [Chitinophaga barathri]RPD42654.1 hypothetical protein EG028_05675 [Chitinophaga barathri]